MTPSTEEPEYDTTSTIRREDGESYALDVWLLSGHTTPTTTAYTYGRTEGLYKVSSEDCEDIAGTFDGVFDALQEKYGAVDESAFERIPGDAYEVMAEVISTDSAAPYDAVFQHNTAVVHVTPENDPDLVEALDGAFDNLREVVSND